MADTAPLIAASEAEKDELMQLVNGFHMMIVSTYGEDLAGQGKAMAALILTSGTIYGRLVAAGIESGSRPRTQHMLKSMERNFKSGMEIAQRHAVRIMAAEGRVQ